MTDFIRSLTCQKCLGTGYVPKLLSGLSAWICPQCKGTGKGTYYDQPTQKDTDMTTSIPAPNVSQELRDNVRYALGDMNDNLVALETALATKLIAERRHQEAQVKYLSSRQVWGQAFAELSVEAGKTKS